MLTFWPIGSLLGGKLLYRESDIERLLMEGYRPATARM